MPQNPDPASLRSQEALRRTVALVAALNFAYFFVEFSVGRAIGSVSLFADSVDFLEDASINALILAAIRLKAAYRRIAGFAFAGILLIPSFAALMTAWEKISNPAVADPLKLTLTAFGALLVNGFCAYLLVRFRHSGGSLSKAAFLSARNDLYANIAMIAAGGLTAATASVWPDVVVGLGIAALNASAAHEVYEAALGETDGEKN